MPRIELAIAGEPRARVEQLLQELGLAAFGHGSVEFTFQQGRLGRTYVKLGPIPSSELRELAELLAAGPAASDDGAR